jgi:DNA-binding transcriptional MocR family regulator
MAKKNTRYEKLANEIGSRIRAGVLEPGDRLPSVRHTGRMRGLSTNTVLQAYYLLEDRGQIRARSKSGFFVAACRDHLEPGNASIAPGVSQTGDVYYDMAEANKSRSYVHFGSSWPSPHLYPLDKLARAFAASSRKLDLTDMSIHWPPGNRMLRRQVARRSLEWGFDGDENDVVITAGALDAIATCLRCVAAPGDLVAIENATPRITRSVLERHGLRAIEILTHKQDGISLRALSLAMKKHPIKACLLMPNFAHPLGSLMPEPTKRELVQLLADNDIPLIENDVYGELYHGASRPLPAKAFDKKGLVLYCASFSKCLAPGYSVGWTLPGRFTERLLRSKWTTYSSTSIPTQAAIAEYLVAGGFDHHLRRLRKNLATQRSAAVAAVLEHFPRGTAVCESAGGYCIWIELPQDVNAENLYRASMDRHITVAPGTLFSANREYGNCLRLNYTHPWGARTEAAIRALGDIIRLLR